MKLLLIFATTIAIVIYHENCVLGLYNRNEEVITANCPWKTVTATDFAVQLRSNKLVLYHSNNKDAQLVCGKTSVT
jgi:hypothetical protein